MFSCFSPESCGEQYFCLAGLLAQALLQCLPILLRQWRSLKFPDC